jgi:DNA-binding response OmpR family regulator
MSDKPAIEQTVFVIDDDEAVRDSLGMLLRTAGLQVQLFKSARAFLKHFSPECSGCLILDIRMPVMSGLDLQDELYKRRCRIPIVFLTGHGDIPMAVRALKKGAFDFIEKPHDEQRLVLATCHALRADAEQRCGMACPLAFAAGPGGAPGAAVRPRARGARAHPRGPADARHRRGSLRQRQNGRIPSQPYSGKVAGRLACRVVPAIHDERRAGSAAR